MNIEGLVTESYYGGLENLTVQIHDSFFKWHVNLPFQNSVMSKAWRLSNSAVVIVVIEAIKFSILTHSLAMVIMTIEFKEINTTFIRCSNTF
jgi:hypothetical protein